MPQTIIFFLRRHLSVYIGLAVLGLVIGVLEAINLAVFIPMLNNLVGAAPVSNVGLLLGWVLKAVGWMPVSDPFLAAGGLFLLLTLLKGGLSIYHEYLAARASGDVLYQYRRELLERYSQAPLAFFDRSRAGGVVYDLTMPPVMLSKLLYTLPRAMIDFLRFFFVLVVLLYLEPRITLTIAALGLATYFLFSRKLSAYSYRLSSERRIAEQNMSSLATEWLRGIRPIRIAGAESHWLDGFDCNSRVSRSNYIFTSVLLASPRHVFELLAFSLLLVGLMVSYSLDPNSFRSHVATIGFFAMGLVRVMPSLATLARTPMDIRNMLPDVEYLHDCLLNLPVIEIAGGQPFVALSDGIRFDRVSISYPERGRALDDVSLFIPKGNVVAFVGSSGAGKSTLLSALLASRAPDGGVVSFDGCNVDDLDKADLRARIGYVGQDILLFHGSVRDNIAFFKKNIPMERIREAAQIAEIADFIESMPDGYESQVGEGGVNFSGGQAQRLAIARAIVSDPDILVLDEATSSLDATSERAVIGSLQRASENRTVIMVTHRLSSAVWADRIYVMERGGIVESGAWGDLMGNTNGRFFHMCQEQHLVESRQ